MHIIHNTNTMCMLCYTRICYVYYKSLQAEEVTKPRTFADACAHPSAKRLVVRGRTGPINAVEADGALFIENDGAEAEAIPSKAMEPASEVAAASKAVATTATASEVVVTAALDPATIKSPAVIKSNSYAAAVSKPSDRPKLSTAAYQLSANLKRPSASSKPTAVPTPLEVNVHMHMNMHKH